MGRDAKPYLNPEVSRPAFPLPRRTSLTSSFSLPTLSLSSRSKAAQPSLALLDTTRAGGNPLDDESTSSSCITPSSSQPLPLSSSENQSRPSSPLKPPLSPGSSVPLPSIRSLRSRFSFSTPQESPNTPGQSAQNPSQKRVTSRRFLPFGNFGSSNSTPSATPSIPRKSLGDVFALGRSSTSSRFDSVSSRSGTPSSRSTRSVTSTGAATLRAGWTPSSRSLTPGGPASSIGFPRPYSHDYSLDSDLGYVVAIQSQDDTIRQRPDISPLQSSPQPVRVTLPTAPPSQEDLTQSSLGDGVTHLAVPPLAHRAVTVSLGAASSAPTLEKPLVSNLEPPPKQPALRHIVIPPPVDLNLPAAAVDNHEKTPLTALESETGAQDSLTSTFPFTPVDDRSDVTSSTANTPGSTGQSLGELRTVPPPLPSPSLRMTGVHKELPFLPPLHQHGPSRTGVTAEGTPSSSDVASARDPSPNQSVSATNSPASNEQYPLASSMDTSFSPFLPSSALSLVEEEVSFSASILPQLDLPSEPVSLPTEFDLRERRRKRIGQLLSSLDVGVVNGDLPFASRAGDAEHSGSNQTSRADGQIVTQDASMYRSDTREDPVAVSARSSGTVDKNLGEDKYHTLDSDLFKLLSPHRLLPLPSLAVPGSASLPSSASPNRLPVPLATNSWVPQTQSSPAPRTGTRALHLTSTPSPSSPSFRPSDVLPPRAQRSTTPAGAPNDKNLHSARSSPVPSTRRLASESPYGTENSNAGDFLTSYGRAIPHRSPSVTAAMTRKRSASFDLSGSTTFMKDSSDPFTMPKRTDWLGPKTAKAFAAAGLLDREKERSGPFSSVRSETPGGHRGIALNSWRTHSERNVGAGSVRSHSRLGSEIISPSYRSRHGGDSSPSYGRGSLDLTAPPSPVSTHRTLVSSVTSSSQSQQSALQMLRERHELETEALLLALAGSKRSERDLLTENEELAAYVAHLEQRVASLEAEREQERSKRRIRERGWEATASSEVDALDKRRQDILLGRPSTRGWGAHTRVKTVVPSRSPGYASSRTIPSPSDTPRSASTSLIFRNELDAKSRSTTPVGPLTWTNSLPPKTSSSPIPRTSTPPTPSARAEVAPASISTDVDFDPWNEDSFIQPPESGAVQDGRQRLSSASMASLLPQMPGSMSMLVHERPVSGPLSEEDEFSFGSASPSSLTLVQPRNSTPKPSAPNMSPVTADFSFNSIPGSPRSLRLRPEEEMHLADLISLQGLEITDVIGDLN
ncbi:hypothetical protein BDV93DRAFT_610628 [Ceratobasidium sp. AG-I]|nr:hypothetical protein BDV93DRAFT_610628 [Ceratobasidium sp. AG-I]